MLLKWLIVNTLPSSIVTTFAKRCRNQADLGRPTDPTSKQTAWPGHAREEPENKRIKINIIKYGIQFAEATYCW